MSHQWEPALPGFLQKFMFTKNVWRHNVFFLKQVAQPPGPYSFTPLHFIPFSLPIPMNFWITMRTRKDCYHLNILYPGPPQKLISYKGLWGLSTTFQNFFFEILQNALYLSAEQPIPGGETFKKSEFFSHVFMIHPNCISRQNHLYCSYGYRTLIRL